MIVAIANEKGGAGETTLATSISAWLETVGRDVILIDADSQRSSTRRAEKRHKHSPERPKVHSVEKATSLAEAMRDLASRYQEVVIDGGGRDNAELRSALTFADVVYVSLKAFQLDLETLLAMARHLREASTDAQGWQFQEPGECCSSMTATTPSIDDEMVAREKLEGFEIRQYDFP